MKTNSDVRPKQIYPLGDDTYHFNYNVEEVLADNEEGEEIKSFVCDTVHVSKVDYATIISAMIAEKYSIIEEIAINRQRDSKQQEFQEYFDYCESCKNIARNALGE
ncbi:MAG: hypothetical protein PHI32_07970 [Dysgonamonadaceae bacterium]|nr:hypothetical protein [Dysgonamonadaceae bacterium]